jgi:hypothetical protein
MIGAVNQHAGDTGRSHLANRYFFGSLHRGWPLDELDETEASPTREQPGGRAEPAELRAGANQFSWGIQRMSARWIAIA